MIWITQNFWSQRLIEVILKICKLEKDVPFFSIDNLKTLEQCACIPVDTHQLNIINLCFNELISYLFYGWEVGVLFLIHHQNHSASRWRQTSCLFFAVVQACPLQIGITDKMCLTQSASFRFNRIMASRSIWSVSSIVFRSPDQAYFHGRLISDGTRF